MNKGIRAYRRQTARDYLFGQLILLSNGGKLPSLRQMMEQSRLSRAVLEGAIAEAEQRGLIACRPKSGIYRTITSVADCEAIGIAINNYCNNLAPVGSYNMPSESSRIISKLCEIGNAKGIPMRVFRYDEEFHEAARFRRLFIVFPQDPKLVTRLEDTVASVVTIGGRGGRCRVTVPSSQQVEAALRYLVSYGHHKIGFIYNQPPDQAPPRLLDYYRFMAENNLRTWKHWVASYPDEAYLLNGLEKMFSDNLKPTAICMTSPWLQTVYGFFNKKSILIGHHISIITIGYDCEVWPRPTLSADYPECRAELAWQLMEQNAPCGEIFSEIKIIPGYSVSHVAPET